ncbi:hypothetical protein AVEN_231952-1 [Araneus ventricosus]|uniref:Uncharacterized protein n=1 Tax=Araneus ventricosus TaxID=182803 RepID=A0A4Y2BZZ9_ARAVE|nr:hypothetical protein AVEN_231952-1 [Araneus ventricosus]
MLEFGSSAAAEYLQMALPLPVTSEYQAAENSKRRQRGTRRMNDVGFFLTKTKDDDVPSLSYDELKLLQLYISVNIAQNNNVNLILII